MINEDALAYKRGELVEFTLHLGVGPKRCRGLVLNTAVLYGRAARQVWIVDMDDATPQQEAQWTKKKHIVPEGEISGLIPTVLIGRDTLLRDNPICYPVQNLKEVVEIQAVTVSVALPVPQPVENEPKKTEESSATTDQSSCANNPS
jgi:hypothetical protein